MVERKRFYVFFLAPLHTKINFSHDSDCIRISELALLTHKNYVLNIGG